MQDGGRRQTADLSRRRLGRSLLGGARGVLLFGDVRCSCPRLRLALNTRHRLTCVACSVLRVLEAEGNKIESAIHTHPTTRSANATETVTVTETTQREDNTQRVGVGVVTRERRRTNRDPPSERTQRYGWFSSQSVRMRSKTGGKGGSPLSCDHDQSEVADEGRARTKSSAVGDGGRQS